MLVSGLHDNTQYPVQITFIQVKTKLNENKDAIGHQNLVLSTAQLPCNQQPLSSVCSPTLARHLTVRPVEIPQFHVLNFDVISKLTLLITGTPEQLKPQTNYKFSSSALMLHCAVVLCSVLF
jgi:hypothetical protein